MTISTINWVIVSATLPFRGFFIMNGSDQIGTITPNGEAWVVEFNKRPQLSFSWSGDTALNVCVGYVRGIERCKVNEYYGNKKVMAELA